MPNEPLDTALLDRAIIFAVKAHAGTERRGKGFPYIVHPLESMEIVSTISNDQELLAAAVLHDTVEDTDVTIEGIREEFGDRVAELVAAETSIIEEETNEEKSWYARKKMTLDHLACATLDQKIVALGDKLSNMRAISRDFAEKGQDLWNLFHSKNPKDHEWYYRGLADSLSDLKDTYAFQEFEMLVDRVFSK